MKNFIFLLTLVLLTVFSHGANLPKNILEVESEIQKANGVISSKIVGDQVADLFLKSFGNDTLPLTGISVRIVDGHKLVVSGDTFVWDVKSMSGSITFWFESNELQCDAQFTIAGSYAGSLDHIWKRFSTGATPKGVSFTKGNNPVMFEAYYTSSTEYIGLGADIQFSKSSPYLKPVTALLKQDLTKSVPAVFKFSRTSKLEGDFPDFHWEVPGNYTLFKGVILDNIVFDAGIEPFHVSVTCDIIFSPNNSPLMISASGKWSEGNPLVLEGDLTAPWEKPLGLKWLTVSTGSSKITIGEQQASVKLDGTGFLHWAASETVTVSVDIGGSECTDFDISVSNLPVFGFNDMYKEMTGKTTSVLAGVSSRAQGIASFSISNYNGPFPAGLSIKGIVTVERGGDIYKANSLVDPNVGDSTIFELDFFSPVFSANPEYIKANLKITNPWIVKSGLSATYLEFDVNVNSITSIDVDADFSWSPKHEANPVTFETTGSFTTGSDQLTLNAHLTSAWPNAFGKHYLTIQTGSVTFSFSPSEIDLTMSGSALFNFTNEQTKVQFRLDAQDNFEDVTFQCDFEHDWTVGYIASEISGFHIDALSDFTFTDKVTVGLLLVTGPSPSISVTSTGNLLKSGSKLEKALTRMTDKMSTITWTLAFNIPLSGATIQNWDISLTFADEIAIRPNLWFENTAITLNYHEIQLSAEFKAKLKGNPDVLTFKIDGIIGADDFGFEGEMLGKWVDVFGVKGFTLKDVVAEIDFSPAACSDGACISKLDLAFTTWIGGAELEFAGGVAYPDFLDSFLLASYKRDLEVRDICEQWNVIAPNHKIDMDTVPKGWTMHPVSQNNPKQLVLLEIAGTSGSFGPYQYQEGFHVIMMLKVIGLHVDINVGCTFSDLTPDCTFKWDVNVDKTQFQNAISKELDIMRMEREAMGLPMPELGFKVNSVKLFDWQSDKLATNTNPKWDIDLEIDILGHHNKKLDFRCPLTILHGNFNQFFKNYIKHIFEAAIDAKLEQEKIQNSVAALHNASRICVVNDAGFVMNFHLKDLFTNQESKTTPDYPIDQSKCLDITTIPYVKAGDAVMCFVHADAGETKACNWAVKYDPHSDNTETFVCRGTTLDFHCDRQ